MPTLFRAGLVLHRTDLGGRTGTAPAFDRGILQGQLQELDHVLLGLAADGFSALWPLPRSARDLHGPGTSRQPAREGRHVSRLHGAHQSVRQAALQDVLLPPAEIVLIARQAAGGATAEPDHAPRTEGANAGASLQLQLRLERAQRLFLGVKGADGPEAQALWETRAPAPRCR